MLGIILFCYQALHFRYANKGTIDDLPNPFVALMERML